MSLFRGGTVSAAGRTTLFSFEEQYMQHIQVRITEGGASHNQQFAFSNRYGLPGRGRSDWMTKR